MFAWLAANVCQRARTNGQRRRVPGSAESAVQLHFSALAHRTNQVLRTMMVITAVFAPLTLITGVFGVNFGASLPEHEHFVVTRAVKE